MVCPVCGSENPARAEVCFTCRGLLAPITRGTVIASRYVVLRWLGQGAMGTVYEARDRILDEPVALKVFRVDPDEPADLARRFRSEIKLARRVTHPYVCRLYEYGEEQSCRYISMELIEGQDLKRVVRERGPLPPREACRVAIQIADGLHAVHRVGIVHRDLKPQNVMLDRQGDAKLMDFGLAKSWRAEGTSGRPGYVVGTPEYMSPEQARGETVDLRSDIYALGIVCYEIFTGAVPFRGTTPATTLLLQIQQPPPLGEAEGGEADPRLPPALMGVLRRALAKQPQERYPSALAVADALREVRAGLPGADAAPAPPEAPEPLPREAAPIEVSTRSLRAVRQARPGWRRPSVLALAVALAASLVFWALFERTAVAPTSTVVTELPRTVAPPPGVTRPDAAGDAAPRERKQGIAPPKTAVPAPTPPPEAPPEAPPQPAPSLAAVEAVTDVAEEPGRLQVGAQPWAEVTVDGRRLGYTPMRPIVLPPGEHTARLLHPAYPPVTRTVRIRPGETTQLRVDLRVDANETEKN
jgi:eukaryotic-like serine/threonine-protein kinase